MRQAVEAMEPAARCAQQELNRMLKSVGSNWLLLVFQVAAAFLLTPFVIGKLGNTQYGAWTLIVSITSYLSMLALGIPMTTVRFVAKYSAAGQDEAMNRTI